MVQLGIYCRRSSRIPKRPCGGFAVTDVYTLKLAKIYLTTSNFRIFKQRRVRQASFVHKTRHALWFVYTELTTPTD